MVASDAFFPFADGLIAAAEAGATAVIQPGGSMRDDEVIAAADERGLAMVFTGMRHFRHWIQPAGNPSVAGSPGQVRLSRVSVPLQLDAAERRPAAKKTTSDRDADALAARERW